MSHAETHDYAAVAKNCQNCGAPLTGPYCARCGQHDVDYHRSLHYLMHDLMENLFHFEGKFFVTVAWLLARPGKLTREFVSGRRMSQLNPLRFYLFVSVLFFFMLTMLNHGHLFPISRSDIDSAQSMMQKSIKKTSDGSYEVMDVEPDSGHPNAAPKSAPKKELSIGNLGPHPQVHVEKNSLLGRRLNEKIATGELTLADVREALEHRVPSLFFLGVPLFALLLKVFYLRSGRYYIEHLVFSLHLHTWVFLVYLVGSGYFKLAALASPRLSAWFVVALLLWGLWYMYAAFRNVYQQSRRKTVLKMGLLTFVYGFALLMVAVLLIAVTFSWLAFE